AIFVATRVVERIEGPADVGHRHGKIVDLDLDHLAGLDAVRLRHRHESRHGAVLSYRLFTVAPRPAGLPEQVGGTQCKPSLDRQRRRRDFVKLTRCVRIRLGMLSGLSLQWLVVRADGTVAGGMTPAVLAFLGGYSVEMLFAAMDRLVQLVTGRMRTSNRPGQP